MTATAIIGFVFTLLKELLPHIMPQLVEWLSKPPDPIKIATRDFEKAIAEGDLGTLAGVNQIVIDASGQSDLTKEQLKSMLDF